MWKSRPLAVVVENVCTDAVSPASDVSPPPAPASDPHKNCPVVELYRSLLFTRSEHPVNPAPVILVEKCPVVEVLLINSVEVA